jgi:hypothetical protein
MRKIILLVVLFLFSLTSFADPLPGQMPRVYIFHINGINTEFEEALDNLNNLKAVTYIKSNILTWDLLWNETHGLLTSDIWEVMKMKKQESQNLTIDDYIITYIERNRLNYPKGSERYNILLLFQLKKILLKINLE